MLPTIFHDIPDGEYVHCPIVLDAKRRMRKAKQMVKKSIKKKKASESAVNIHTDASFSINREAVTGYGTRSTTVTNSLTSSLKSMTVGAKSLAVGTSLTSMASASASVSRTVSSRLLSSSTAGSSLSVQSGNVVATSLTPARSCLLSLSMNCDEVLFEDSKDFPVFL